MRELTPLSRRQFGQGLGASLALASTPQVSAAHDGPHVVTVRIHRFAFVPRVVEIRPGDTVVWINEDLAPHTATARDGSWETGILETGDSARISFGAAGDFEYSCALHPHMTGSLSLRPATGG